MRFHIRGVAIGLLSLATATSVHAQVAADAAASSPSKADPPCTAGPTFEDRAATAAKYKALAQDEARQEADIAASAKEGRDDRREALLIKTALQRAYLNTVFTRWEVDYVARQECLAKGAATLAKKAALDDFARSGGDAGAATEALVKLDAARVLLARKTVAESANDSAIEQFLLLKRADSDPDRHAEAKKLAVQVPSYPEIVDADALDRTKAFAEVAKARGTADKAQGLAKEVKTYADDSSKTVLASKASEEDRAKAAQDAWVVGTNVDPANRLAKDAQNVSDVTVDLALRAMKSPNDAGAKVDLATAQSLSAQLNYDKSRLDYIRADALLKKLGIHASEEETLSVAKQRGYVTYLTVVANNPDAQALLGSPGVKLNASSGASTATLKLSAEKVLGLQERLIDVTISAPTTKDRTFIDNSLDGLAGGATLQVTGSQYYLLSLGGAHSKFGILGGGAKIGQETHTYVDVSDFSKTKDTTKAPSSYLAYAGIAPVDMKSLMLAKFEYQNAFKDAKSATECPVQATGPVICQSGAIGLPSQIHKRIWSVEWRQAWESVAVGATLSRDTAGRQTKFDLPVYFLTGTSDKGTTPLTGGIDFSYDTKNHAMFGLFIGAPFSVLDY